VPTFGLPTATTSSAFFGRIRDTVVSSARQVMLGVKYTFWRPSKGEGATAASPPPLAPASGAERPCRPASTV
jgi:hypothetical protein